MNNPCNRLFAIALMVVMIAFLFPGEVDAFPLLRLGGDVATGDPLGSQGADSDPFNPLGQSYIDAMVHSSLMDSPAQAASSGYRLVTSTLASIGSSSQSPNHRLQYTLGQPSMISVGSSENYYLSSGYWSSVVFSMNEPPLAEDDEFSTDEDEPVTFNVVENDVDDNLDTTSVTVVNDVLHGTLTYDGGGSFTYSPQDNYNGTDTFEYRICDSLKVCDTATVNIIVTPINDPPELVRNQGLTTSKGSRSRITDDHHLLVRDVDNPPDEIIYTLLSVPQLGALLVQAEDSSLRSLTVNDWFTQEDVDNDRLSYRHANVTLGGDSFRITVCDEPGLCVVDGELTFEILVNEENQPPEPLDDRYTTNEDTPLQVAAPGLLANDYNAELDEALDVSLNSEALHGSVTVDEDGSFQYTPNPNFDGSDHFSYRVWDPYNEPVVAQAFITVDSINDTPTDIGLSNISIFENQPSVTLVGMFSATDVDTDDHHAYALVPGVGDEDNAYFQVLVEEVNTVLAYRLWTTASFDYETKSEYSIRVEVRDLQGAAFVESFTIQIKDINEPPTIALSHDAILENKEIGTLVGVFSAVDPENSPIAFSLVPGWGDNGLFNISFNADVNAYELKTAGVFDYEDGTQPTRRIKVKVEDDLGWQDEIEYSITILNDLRDDVDTKCNGLDFDLIGGESTQGQVRISDITISDASPSGCSLSGTMQVRIPGHTADSIAVEGRVNQKNEFYSDSIDEFDVKIAGLTLKAKEVVVEYYDHRPMLRIKKPELKVSDAWGGLSVTIPNPTIIDSRGISMSTPEFKLPIIKTKGGFALRLTGQLVAVAEGYEISADGQFTIPGISGTGTKEECGITVGVTIYAETGGSTAMRIETLPMASPLLSTDDLALRRITLGISCTMGIPIDTTGFALTGVGGTVILTPDRESVELWVTISSMEHIGPKPFITATGTTKVTINPSFALDLSVVMNVLSIEAKSSARITENSFTASLEIITNLLKGTVSINAWTSYGKFHFSGSGEVSLGVEKYAWGGPWCLDYPCGVVWCKKWGVPYPCGTKSCQKCTGLPPDTLWLLSAGCEFGEFTNGAYGLKGYVKFWNVSYGFYIDDGGDLHFGNVSYYHIAKPDPVTQFAQISQMAALRHTSLALQPAEVDTRLTFLSENELLIDAPVDQSHVSFIVDSDGPLEVTLIDPTGNEVTPSVHRGYEVHYEQTASYVLESHELHSSLEMPRIRLISASPNPDYEEVDVKVDGVTLFTNVGFTDPRQPEYEMLEPGPHTIEISSSQPDVDPISIALDAEAGQDYSVILLGESVTRALVLNDDNQRSETPGVARVRFVNGSDHHENARMYIGGTEVGACVLDQCQYREVPVGDSVLEVKDANDQLLSESGTVNLQENKVYTFIAVDWLMGGYSLAWSQSLDAAYAQLTRTEYQIYPVPTGKWQVKLRGDLEGTAYTVAVLGRANSPELRELMVDASNLEETLVSWRLWSEYSPAAVKIYLTKGPITEEVEIAQSNGGSSTRTVPVFEGILLDEVSVTDEQQRSGEPMTRKLDLSQLETGDYYLWILVEDGTAEGSANPTIAGYLGGGDVEVNKADYDPLAQLEDTTMISVDQTATFPESWIANIQTSLDVEEAELTVEWDALTHPDVDQYALYVGASPNDVDPLIIEAGTAVADFDQEGNMIGVPVGSAVIRPIEPNQVYYLSVEAQDVDTGNIVRSQEIPFTVGGGDFEISTPVVSFKLDPGDELILPINLVISAPLFYPYVNLAIDLEDSAPGIEAIFIGDLSGTTMLSEEEDTVDLRITIGADTPRGIYPVSIRGYNGSLERTLEIFLVMNNPPVANDDLFTTDEDMALAVEPPGLLANDTDPDGDPLIVSQIDDSQLVGLLAWDADGSIDYDPNGKFESLGSTMTATETFSYTIDDGRNGFASATAVITIKGVNDAPVIGTVEPASQNLQYSDGIAPVTLRATDVDSSTLDVNEVVFIDTSDGRAWSMEETGLVLSSPTCNDSTDKLICEWIMSGYAQVPAGYYDLVITVSDGETETTKRFYELLVISPEDAILWFDRWNPDAVEVTRSGGNSGPISLTLYVRETLPDEALFDAASGDIGLAQVGATLIPVGFGDTADGHCEPVGKSGDGYEAKLKVKCSFMNVPVNTYFVQASLADRFYSGDSEDLLTVYDSMLGFIIGNGSFNWPGTDDQTFFTFYARYTWWRTKLQGMLLIVRRHPAGGISWVRSYYVSSLAVGRSKDGSFEWAVLNGKTTCGNKAGWPPFLGCEFTLYVEDHKRVNGGVDRFWIEIRDQHHQRMYDMSQLRPAVDNAVMIDCGDIDVVLIR
jgi:VCBS repeat-containing protein